MPHHLSPPLLGRIDRLSNPHPVGPLCPPQEFYIFGPGRRWDVAYTASAKCGRHMVCEAQKQQCTASSMLKTIWSTYSASVVYMTPASNVLVSISTAAKRRHTASNTLKKAWSTFSTSVVHMLHAPVFHTLMSRAASRESSASSMPRTIWSTFDTNAVCILRARGYLISM